MRCGFCRVECPTWSFIDWESGTPRGRMMIIKALLDGELEVNDYIAERTYQCTLCGYCLWRCPSGVETTEAIKALRSLLVSRGLSPEALEPISRHIKENKSIYQSPRETRRNWIEKLGLEEIVRIGGEAEVIYFPGCMASLSDRTMKVAGATSTILHAAGLDWAVLGEEWCCGDPLFLSGMSDSAKELAEHNIEAIRGSKAKVLVTSCAGCFRTFMREYPKIIGDLGVEVYHTSQFFIKLLKEGKLRLEKPVNMTATYHDPCELGRLMGVYEPPRDILKTIPGLKLIELRKNRNLTVCCGGGGMLRVTYPDIAAKLAKRKLDEAHEAKAEAIVSACPTCEINLIEAKIENGDDMEVLDISEVVARAIKKER